MQLCASSFVYLLPLSLSSAGASLRRYNESALIKEISELMVSWERFFVRANKVFVRVPHHLRHCFTAGKNNPLAIGELLIPAVTPLLVFSFFLIVFLTTFSSSLFCIVSILSPVNFLLCPILSYHILLCCCFSFSFSSFLSLLSA